MTKSSNNKWAILTNESSGKYLGIKSEHFSSLCDGQEVMTFDTEFWANSFLSAFMNKNRALVGQNIVDPGYKIVELI